MLLSCRILENYVNVNNFEFATEAKFTEGDATDVYFQLIDKSRDRANEGVNPPGRRYIPESGATLSVTVDTLDDAKKITRVCSVVSEDRSIWKLTILATDTVRGTANLRLTLTEGVKVTRGSLETALSIQPKDEF